MLGKLSWKIFRYIACCFRTCGKKVVQKERQRERERWGRGDNKRKN